MQKKQQILPGGDDTSSGAYSPGLVVGDLVFVSGQGPLDPQTHEVSGTTIQEQADLTLKNVQAVLESAGCTLDDCVKVTVHLSDMANFDAFNRVYEKRFKKPFPTRTTVQSVLWHHILIEIDAIAIKGAG